MTEDQIAQVKGMLRRGDRHMDVATWFGVNQARVSEIKWGKGYGKRFRHVEPAPDDALPPRGPYVVVSRVEHDERAIAAEVVKELRQLLDRYTSLAER